MSAAEYSKQQSLGVPSEEGSGKKKARPKSPRKKAPIAPKKKASKEEQKKGKDGSSLDVPKDSEPEGKEGKSLRRSVSPRKEQYSSLLDEMVGKGDMVLLDPITEDAIIENLEKRYTAGEIYVS